MKIKKSLPKFILSNFLIKNEITNSILDDFKNIKKISKIVHPLVRKKLNKFLIRNRKKKMVILDIPLFIENNLNKKNDILIYVKARKSDIQKRLKKRKNYNKKIIDNLRLIQLPLARKKKISEFTLINSFNSNKTKKDIIFIKNKILNK